MSTPGSSPSSNLPASPGSSDLSGLSGSLTSSRERAPLGLRDGGTGTPHERTGTDLDGPRSAETAGSSGHGSPQSPGQHGRSPRGAPTGLTGATGQAVVWGLFGVLVAATVWWLFTHAAGSANSMISAFQPERLPAAAASLWERGVILQDAATSLWQLLCGLALAVLAGVPLGLLIGWSKAFKWASTPPVQFLRMVSPLSWAPVAVALFGVGHAPVVFLVAAAAVWPITMNTAAGVAALDPLHIRVARTLGATPFELVRTVVLPSVRPFVMTGVRLALGIAWVVIVPAEMLGVSSGLGYEILNARDRLAYDEMLVVIIVIGLIGIALDALAQWVLRDRRRP